MYTSALLTLLLSSIALALPQPAPHRRNTPATYSAADGYGGPATSTVTVTSYTTIFTPAASAHMSSNVSMVVVPITQSSSSVLEGTLTLTTTATSTVQVTRTEIVTPSQAGPAVESSTAPELSVPTPSALAGVYICTDINWSGSCTHTFTPLGSAPSSCTTLNGTASSIGPDVGVRCRFYTNSYCDTIFTDESDFITLSYPGTSDLRNSEKGDWNDRVFSFLCFEEDE
ncbi:hypothetical protein NX059_008384 [Plenodomus lindquistii]|nr:hypothetical protein NX059_008384 [Plenodomus lindquistii]